MLAEKFSLDNRVAIVTGGGTGFGKVMSLAMAKAGADIAVAARRIEPLEETAAEVRKLGRRAMAVVTDVTDSRQVNRMVEAVISEFGKVDILVNNAGGETGSEGKPLWEISDEEWHYGIDVNLTGTFFCTRAVSKHMVEQKKGKIISMASAFGVRGGRDYAIYCAAKGGIVLLTMSFALTLGRDGINVNCIAPGMFLTKPPQNPEEEQFYESRAQFYPLGRLGAPREVGHLIVFLASAASDYITGEVFVIDGGALAGGYAPTGYAPVIAI